MLIDLQSLSSMDVSQVEQHSYIKIAVFHSQNARECHAQLIEAVGDRALPYRTVARWVAAFQHGRVASTDMPHTRYLRLLVLMLLPCNNSARSPTASMSCA